MTDPGERPALTLRNLLGDHYGAAKDALDEIDALQLRYARLEAVAEASARLVATLPKCDMIDSETGHRCTAPATRSRARGVTRYCDRHGSAGQVPEYPRAAAVRDTLAALEDLKAVPGPKG